MSYRNLYDNLTSLVQGIELTRKHELILPTMCLIYTGIDIVASIERRPKEGTRDAFQRWCDAYVIRDQGLPYTSADLYAARCGVLHAASAEADLIRKGKARQIVYAWGRASAADLARAAEGLGYDCATLHIDEFFSLFRAGIADFMDDLVSDPARKASLSAASNSWLSRMPAGVLRRYLELTDNGER